MDNPKGKLIVIGGSIDRGSFSESKEDLKRNLKFFEKGILKRITTESLKGNLSVSLYCRKLNNLTNSLEV